MEPEPLAKRVSWENPRHIFRLRVLKNLINGLGRVGAPIVVLKDWASCQWHQIRDGLDCMEVCAPGAKQDQVLLYFHGGGHLFCSASTHRELSGRLSAATHARAFSVNYRLAPDNPFPAGLDDALASWHWVLASNPSATIAVAGDSAGGNLAFALMLRLAQLSQSQPACCIGLSPWLILDPETRSSTLEGQTNEKITRRNQKN